MNLINAPEKFNCTILLLLFPWAGVQPTLDPYAVAFFIAGPLR